LMAPEPLAQAPVSVARVSGIGCRATPLTIQLA
jgi:hypothetical protein